MEDNDHRDTGTVYQVKEQVSWQEKTALFASSFPVQNEAEIYVVEGNFSQHIKISSENTIPLCGT